MTIRVTPTVLLLGATGRTGACVLHALPQHVTVRAGLRAPGDVRRLAPTRANLTTALVDLANPDTVCHAAAGCHVIINAIRLRDDIPANALTDLNDTLEHAITSRTGTEVATDTKIVTIGGAGALHMPDGTRYWQSPTFPTQTLPRGRAHAHLRDHLERGTRPVAWAYLIPPGDYRPNGPNTGNYHQTKPPTDERHFATQHISYADFAHAITDTALADRTGTTLISWP